ncbi:hypothetical protein ACLKA6_003251 [Drosophila palustris]
MPTRTHYKSATLDVDAFQLAIGNMSVSGNAETMAQQAAQALQHACGVSMQRSGSYRRHNAVYWWTDQIAKARAECLKARRAYCRARGTEAHASLRLQYCDKRRLLKRAIKDQKRLCFLRMCEEADRDPWGQAYKVVMKRTRSFKNSVPTEKMQLTAIVSTLFPHQHERNPDHTNDEQNSHPVATITAGEVIQAARSIKNDTAPGPDGIPNRALKLAISVQTNVASSTRSYLKGIEPTNRMGALRISRAFRTVSGEAFLVIAGIIPIDILAQERSEIHTAKSAAQPPVDMMRIKVVERERSLSKWQHRWEAADKGRWTRQLIRRIEPWFSRKHCKRTNTTRTNECKRTEAYCRDTFPGQ